MGPSLFIRRSVLGRLLVLSLAILPTAGCLFRTRPVEEKLSTVPLKTSTKQELIDVIDRQAAGIQSLKATVDIDTSAGGVKKGHVTDYKEIRGFVLARRPASLHMTGLMPIVRTLAFDMASDGQRFQLWIPSKNRFVMGLNQMPTPNTDQPMENLRPQNIYDALLIPAIDPQNEIVVMENGYETLHDSKGHPIVQDDYELIIIRKTATGGDLERKIVFGRVDLKPHQQYIYDENAKVATEARYAEYKDYDGVSFPSRVEITRPQEEYDITMHLLKVDVNTPLTDDQFVLEQPARADVVHLDRPQSSLVMPQGGGRP
jgi:Domain of unknown function (DUF4292)